jgi:hypothetical protein
MVSVDFKRIARRGRMFGSWRVIVADKSSVVSSEQNAVHFANDVLVFDLVHDVEEVL